MLAALTGYPANAAQPEQFAITSSTTSSAVPWWEQTFLQCLNHSISQGETASNLTAWRSFHGKAKKCHLGRHRHRHCRWLLPTPLGGVCRVRGGLQKGNQVRTSRLLVHLHPACFRNLWTNQWQGHQSPTRALKSFRHRLRTISDYPCELAFLRQRISITLQRFNAIAFSDTFTSASETEVEV